MDFINSIEAVILAGGDYPTCEHPLTILREARYVVCCDGATNEYIARGNMPDAIVGDAVEFGHDRLDESGDYRNEGAAAALEDDNELGDLFRNQAFDVKPTKDITYTIEIAPVNNYEDKPLFYGRIKETGEIFELSFQDGVSMGQMPIEPSLMKQIDKEIKEQSK